jgi:hypothetical protein
MRLERRMSDSKSSAFEAGGRWVRFEGPGKLHAHRWHRVELSPFGRFVTLCGLYVGDAPISDRRGEGVVCASCQRLSRQRSGGYL